MPRIINSYSFKGNSSNSLCVNCVVVTPFIRFKKSFVTFVLSSPNRGLISMVFFWC